MPLPLSAVIVLGAAALVGLLYAFMHRRLSRPLVNEGVRGSPMPIVVGTSFAVLLAFVILSAFQNYAGAKSGAQSEAEAVLDITRTAELFPPGQRREIRSDIVCYGRAVISQEWPAMRNGQLSPTVERWVTTYRAALARVDLRSTRERLAFQELLNLAADRTAGRQQRLSDDTPAVPTPLWLALIFVGCVAVALQFGQAGPSERTGIQALMVAGVTAVVTTGLVVVFFLDHPYQAQGGGIQPTAMQRILVMVHEFEPSLRPACTASGLPLPR